MQIIIKTSAVDISLEVEPSHTIRYVKDKIHEETSIHPSHQELIFSNEQLKDERILSDYNIQEKSTIDFKLLVPSYEKVSEAIRSLRAFTDSHTNCDVGNVSSEIAQEAMITLKTFADSNANSLSVIADLCKTNLSIDEDKSKLKTLCENALRQKQEQTSEIKQLRDDLSKVNSELKDVKQELKNMKHVNEILAAQLDNVNAQLAVMKTANQSLLGKVDAFKELSENLEKRMVELEKKK